jgi:hypothetical protein
MNSNSNALLGLVILLTIIVAVLAYVLFTTPAPEPGVPAGGNQNGQPATSTPQSLDERVVVTTPASGATVDGTFTVSGEAPGPWYFEASFPIEVQDDDGNVLTTVVAQADGEWMTVEQVPFSVDVAITGYTGPAMLVLKRDNPSGLPENDASVEVPIVIE